ncbi:hypothetical protein LguiA_008190 [Lonicera macranthoides]
MEKDILKLRKKIIIRHGVSFYALDNSDWLDIFRDAKVTNLFSHTCINYDQLTGGAH